jgi:hypothetical protein
MGQARPERNKARMVQSPQKRLSCPSEPSPELKKRASGLPGLCREEQLLLGFLERSRPVEAVLLAFFLLGRRMELSVIFVGAKYRHDSA